MKLNNIQLLKNSARNFVSSMGKSDALIPIIILEAAVTGGRSYQAYQRGGFVEGRERLTEETIGAVFWLGGVTAFNKMGDTIGKRVLGFDKINFDVGKDAVRNPLVNFLNETATHGEKALSKIRLTNVNSKTLAIFKFAKVISSILLANTFVGFIVPKLNQRITKHYQESIENLNRTNAKLNRGSETFDKFSEKITKKNQDKTPSFKGLNVQSLLSIANCFENDAKYKLLSTDVGIASGRAYNARNKHERREILFRDVSSIYFYLFCRSHLNTLLNQIEDGKSTRLDTKSAKIVHDLLISEKFNKNQQYSAEEFEKFVFGNKAAKIPDAIEFKNGLVELESLRGKMKPAEFEIAQEMSNLQPAIAGKSILTKYQVKDIYQGGLINNPKLLKEVFEGYVSGSTSNPMKFVPEQDLIKLKARMSDYIHDIMKKATKTGENVSVEMLKKISRQNFWKNSFNLGVGFAVSGYFLSTAIPKLQYWMTKMQTGSNRFPGVEHYDEK